MGERASHTWFVLTGLLGYPQVRNDDGVWTAAAAQTEETEKPWQNGSKLLRWGN